MVETNRDELFENYTDSSFRQANILTKEQFEIACDGFERDYRGLLPENKNAKILDFGCGAGHFLYYLQKKGYTDFFGVDFSPSQVSYCRENVSDRVEVIDGMKFLEDKHAVYELIVAHDVMEHLPKNDTVRFIKLVFQALKNGGTILVRVPNMSNPLGLDARYSDLTHCVGFTEKSLYQVLWVAGFREIRILPPRVIPVRSLRNLVRKILVKAIRQWLRFCYYIQDYTVPRNLDKNIVAVAKKTGQAA